MQPALLDGPDVTESDPFTLLLGYLAWFREALERKTAGLTDEQLRTPLPEVGWSPIGLVQHLGWVERRWLQWGFRALPVVPYPPGDEWVVTGDVSEVWAFYRAEVARSEEILAGASLLDPSLVGGRFPTAEQAPSLSRILFHVYQEYARHLGHLDIARQLIDGATGE
jgi:uncharacterized damage-inducible protein DinB